MTQVTAHSHDYRRKGSLKCKEGSTPKCLLHGCRMLAACVYGQHKQAMTEEEWMMWDFTCQRGLTLLRSCSGSIAASFLTLAQQKNRLKSMWCVLYKFHTCKHDLIFGYSQEVLSGRPEVFRVKAYPLLACRTNESHPGVEKVHVVSEHCSRCSLARRIQMSFTPKMTRLAQFCRFRIGCRSREAHTRQPDMSRSASLAWPATLSPSATPRRRTPCLHLSHCMTADTTFVRN